MPAVSIVIPAFNAAPFIGATLDSALAGSFSDIELVVIDDGSVDNTAEIAAARGPRVRVLRQQNQGMSASRNRGIQSGDSEFVALLDADDLWHPDKLALQLRLLKERPEFGLCYTEFLSWDGQAPFQWDAAAALQLDERLSGWMYAKMLLTNWVLPSSMLIRRDALTALGQFPCDDQFTDDWAFTVRASRQFQFGKLADRLVAYRQSPGSLSRRPWPSNVTELMRDSLIQRYGTISPQGESVDEHELTQRRHRGWLHFANLHVARGDLGTGLRTYGGLLLRGPHRHQTALTLSKSLVRRWVGPTR